MRWQPMGAGLVVLAGLGSCMVGPHYHTPQVPAPWALNLMASISISTVYSKIGRARKRGNYDGQSSIS
jgi:hypothetical protein